MIMKMTKTKLYTLLSAVCVMAIAVCILLAGHTAKAPDGASNNILSFEVGNFPAYNDIQPRAIGTPDPGKTEWANGDEITITLTSDSYEDRSCTLTYDGSAWELTGKLQYLDGENPAITAVYGEAGGTAEYLVGSGTLEGTTIKINFASRPYSRLRIAGEENKIYSVTFTGFTPAGGSEVETATFDSLVPDANDNMFLYGLWSVGSKVTVTSDNTTVVEYEFKATDFAGDGSVTSSVVGRSYALDACDHTFTDVTYTWSDELTTCTASGTCSICGREMVIETVNAVLDDQAADDGYYYIRANFTKDGLEVQSKKSYTVTTDTYEIDTYEVYDSHGLYAWASATGTDATSNLKLMADITLPNKDLTTGAEITVTEGVPSGSNWTPVGTGSSYQGDIDGNNKTITGLRINGTSSKIGFVGEYNGYEIKNLHLDDVAVYSTESYVGGIVGSNDNEVNISGCTVKSGSVISAGNSVGGIVGFLLNGTITNCENHATISGYEYVGGIVGNLNKGDVTGCANTGTVTGEYEVGGIAGDGSDYTTSNNDVHIIAGCSNSGTVTNGGGVFGCMNKAYTVIACVNTGNVVNGAGIVKYNAGKVVASYTTQNSAVVANCSYQDENSTGSITAAYYLLGEDDAIDGTIGVSDLNTDDVLNTMNTAISTWNASNENACAYMWKKGTTYPELTEVTE